MNKKSAKEISEQRDILEAVINSMPDLMVVKDRNLIYQVVNSAFCEFIGKQQDEIIGKTDFDLFPHEEAEIYRRDDARIIETGKPQIQDEKITEGQSVKWLQVSKTPVFDSKGVTKGVLCAVRDITDRKRMEDDIIKSSKLESMGVLAGGIAHDFNNLLQAILGNISIAKTYSNPENRVYKVLERAESSYVHAISLTNQLLTFSKGGQPIKKGMFIRNLVSDMTKFSLSGSNIKSRFNLYEDLWPVEADEGQIAQVIQNIVFNARDAMPSRGMINVAAENITVSEEDSISLESGKYVKISIEDHGIGISKESLPKIFDPYFTTKDMGSEKGTGLGLTISYSIIKNHGGLITADSEPYVGTKFHIYLPATAKHVEEQIGTVLKSIRGTGRVLVMDDEEVVTDFVKEFLGHVGYEVDVAKDGEKAIKMYEKAGEEQRPFDVVILDLTVRGGMGGKETITKLLEIAPDIKVLASSGDSSDPVMIDFNKYGFKGILTKPYRVEQLGDAVSNLLN